MIELLERVKEVFSTRQRKKVSDFDQLTAAVVDGKGPDAATIAVQLEECGKTPEDLAGAVEYRQQRRQDAAILAEIPALENEKAELERKGREEDARFEALLKPLAEEHRQIADKLNGRYRYITARIPQAEGVKARLLQTYVGPLTAELDENLRAAGGATAGNLRGP